MTALLKSQSNLNPDSIFDTEPFASSFDAAVDACEELTREEAIHFVQHGYVVLKEAFSRGMVDEICEQAWRELESEHHIDRTNPASWSQPVPGRRGMAGYIRTRGSGNRYILRDVAPRAFFGQTDLIGGLNQGLGTDLTLRWGDAAIGNLGIDGDARWQPPAPQQPGWHKDGWHFRHFLNSPEQGLLTVPIYSDIKPRSGGTFMAKDSIAPIARLLRDNPQGLHPDSVQGSGFLIPGLIEQCTEFVELTGNAGDLALLHPFVMHRVSINPTSRPRFIANVAVVIRQPMQFQPTEDHALTLVELGVLYALHQAAYRFDQTRKMRAFKPAPFRDDDERRVEHEALQGEMREFAANGLVTPKWARECGYMSNREYIN